MSRRVPLLLACFTLLFALALPALGQDAPSQINLALADLSERLNQGITLQDLAEWRYSQNRYTDTALGCGLVSGEPRPEGLLAYTFNLTYRGTTYEYRVSLDGTLVFPCDPQLLSVTIVPPPTNVPCPSNFEGLLPSQLIGAPQARVVTEGGPLRLRAEPSTSAQQIGTINAGDTVDLIGGPSCGDGFVWYRVSYRGQVGWTAEGALPDQYFLEVLDVADDADAAPTLTPTPEPVAATPPPITPIPLQPGGQPPVADEGDLPELAGVIGGSLTFVDLVDGQAATQTAVASTVAPSGPGIVDITWSPDGTTAAYTLVTEDFTYDLYLMSSGGGEPLLVASDVYTAMPPAFSADASQLLYAKRGEGLITEGEGPGGAEPVNIFQYSPLSSANPALVATIGFGVGCGGGSPFPGDHVYEWEAGYGGRDLVLEMTPYGLVHSTNCTGSGTALMTLDSGQSVALGTNLSRVDVNGDGTRLVGISDEQMGFGSGPITVVDLDTLAVTPLGAVAAPDQVAWGPGGEIYYSVRETTGAVLEGSAGLAGLEAVGMDAGLPRNTVAIHRVDLAATTDAEIYTGEAYGVGRLFATPDGESLYFTTIPNGEALADALRAGAIDVMTAEANQLAAFFLPTLHRLPLAGGEAAVVLPEILQATLNEAAYAQTGAAQG